MVRNIEDCQKPSQLYWQVEQQAGIARIPPKILPDDEVTPSDEQKGNGRVPPHVVADDEVLSSDSQEKENEFSHDIF